MNASSAFRSHLMQQFASAARSQSRPPLAMMPWMMDMAGDDQDPVVTRQQPQQQQAKSSQASRRTTSNSSRRRRPSSPLPFALWSLSTVATASTTTSTRQNQSTTITSTRRPPPAAVTTTFAANNNIRSLSSVAEDEATNDNEKNAVMVKEEPQQQEACCGDDSTTNDSHRLLLLARQFQALIQTRRTTSHFAAATTESNHDDDDYDYSFWKDAIDRAAECGRRAPNHKRTEAFSFKRVISPSPAIQELAEIAYQVTFKKSQSTVKSEKKRDKWQQVPAYLVAMQQTTTDLEEEPNSTSSTNATGPYDPLPFVPLSTEREMEDYAATCAAIQNILLSLHAEGIASKWATGPVIKTPAFRQLVGATPQDRIVGLIMIGLPKQQPQEEEPLLLQQQQKRRRFRRDWEDFLKDL